MSNLYTGKNKRSIIMTVEFIKPSSALYIKLGRGGKYEREAIERNHLRLGYREISHELCLQGK
jgi:hypothetical protein